MNCCAEASSRPTRNLLEGRGQPVDTSAIEARRREVSTLLEEIKAPWPSPDSVFEAVRRAAGRDLGPERLARIRADILALYGAR